MRVNVPPATIAGGGARRRRMVFVACALGWAVVVGLLAWRAWGRALDDFFITYRYADNLARGLGFTFNPGERVFGTTAPGFALLLALLSATTRLDVPALGTLTTAVALWGLALLLLDELSRNRRTAEGVAAGTLVVTSTYVWPQHGSEVPWALALLLVAARWTLRRPALAGSLAAFATWCRPE